MLPVNNPNLAHPATNRYIHWQHAHAPHLHEHTGLHVSDPKALTARAAQTLRCQTDRPSSLQPAALRMTTQAATPREINTLCLCLCFCLRVHIDAHVQHLKNLGLFFSCCPLPQLIPTTPS
mmetsp:Transcript_20120/g.43827  ORF Transcript_20120/g.43827 Transcript_20120/m.43827 type:complete len:121 (-) Transcript_20120:2596-2958(-)